MSKYFKPTPPALPLPKTIKKVGGNFWKPTPEFVDELVEFLAGKKVLEIFAGNGYLAGVLSSRGIDITSTSLFAGHDSHSDGLYFPVVEMDAVMAVATLGPVADVLLVSWPTVTPRALDAVLTWGTDKDIAYIGETTDYSKNQLGGCATDAFFEAVHEVHRFESYEGNHWESALVYRVCRTDATNPAPHR